MTCSGLGAACKTSLFSKEKELSWTAPHTLIWWNVSVKSSEIPYGCSNIFQSRLFSESTHGSIYLFICHGKLPWWKHSYQLYPNTCYMGALCPPHLQADVGCWVNTKLWASLISFPHTAISLNSARPLMAWEVALAIPMRMSWASCPCLQHIHHVARASWEGGAGIALGVTNTLLGLHCLCSQSYVRGRLMNSTQQGELSVLLQSSSGGG